jgi:hypothetical protein
MVKDIRRVTELHSQGDDGDGTAELAQEILTRMHQAEILVRILNDISTRQETKRTLQDVGELVGKSRQILAAILSGKCELVMRSSPEPLKVRLIRSLRARHIP